MRVIVYTLPACVQCDSTKRVLTRGSVEFDEVNLAEDAAAMERIKGLGYTAAPVVEAGDSHWSGFRLAKIQNLIQRIDGETAKQ
jgi:glutaredoxin-like protein NrdH